MPEPTANSTQTVVAQLLAALREAFEGPHRSSYFTDMAPGAGLLHTLDQLTPREASRVSGGTSIAAHARHILHGMRISTSRISGDRTQDDWRESWRTDPVNNAEWNDIRDGLRSAYRGLQESIEQHTGEAEESFGAALGAITHVVYHLGAIRSKAVCGKE